MIISMILIIFLFTIGKKEMAFSKVIWLNHRDIMHPKAGGAERTIYEVSKRLVNKGYQMIWLSTKSIDLPRYQKLDGIEIHRIGGNVTSHFINLILERKISDGAVFVDDMAHVVPWLSERSTRNPGTVFFRHLHRRTLDGQLTTWKAKSLKAIESNYPLIYSRWPFVTESKQGVQDLRDMGIPSDRIVRIAPGVDSERMRPKEKYVEPSLVYFGGLREYKRPYEALLLLDELRKIYPSIKLRVSGEGPSLLPMKLLASKLGVDRNVEFLGRLDEESLFDVVARSWLNLHFSTAEGWGYSILEASACGTPTVGYSVPGVDEAIIEGRNGIKVPEGDRENFLVSILKILNEYTVWPEVCRILAESYSWDKTADLWERHLTNLS